MSRFIGRTVRARSFVVAAAFSALGIAAGNANAVSILWIGGPATSWGTASNWSSNPALPGSSDSAVFNNQSGGITYLQDIDTGATRTIRGINIGDGTNYVNSFSISNNTLNLVGGTTGLNAAGANTGNVNGSVILQVKNNATTGVPVAGQAGNYTINSNVVLSVAGSGADPSVYNGSANATVTFNGIVSTAVPTPPATIRGGFRADGGGSVVLANGNNSYTGQTTVVAGTLVTRASALIGGPAGTTAFGAATSAIALGSGDTLINNSVALLASDSAIVARNINVSATAASGVGGTGTASIGGGTQGLTPSTFSGTITLGRSLALRSNGNGVNTVDFTGQITGTGALSKTQPGTVRLNSTANNYIGSTTLSAGTLLLGASGVIPDASNLIFSGGTLATGGLNEAAGTLNLTANSAIDFGNASILSLADSSALAWTASTTLQLLNWNGLPAGLGSTRFFVGSGATLTAGQLAALDFVNPAGFDPGTYDALQLPSGEVVPVPEPTALALAAIAAPALLRRRRASQR